jgi:hypothetical protein
MAGGTGKVAGAGRSMRAGGPRLEHRSAMILETLRRFL